MQQDRIYSLKELMEINEKNPPEKDECFKFLRQGWMIENASRQKEED